MTGKSGIRKFSLKNLAYIDALFITTGFLAACWQRYYPSSLATSDGLALSLFVLEKLPDKHGTIKTSLV
ncbi:hypothetical protein [Endozoicomonas sp.]|uniref:hypothetical protein n=1 Tax=Endozoicomonas sp. TaxID=1892382 RepID=UPI003AF6D1F2